MEENKRRKIVNNYRAQYRGLNCLWLCLQSQFNFVIKLKVIKHERRVLFGIMGCDFFSNLFFCPFFCRKRRRM